MGKINWLYGVMGIANAQRTLDTIRIITEFISQPQYSDVVVMFGLVSLFLKFPVAVKNRLANAHLIAG